MGVPLYRWMVYNEKSDFLVGGLEHVKKNPVYWE